MSIRLQSSMWNSSAIKQGAETHTPSLATETSSEAKTEANS